MEQEKEVTVSAVMTAPRYESVYARSQIEQSLHTCGIPLSVSGGVFYGQCMQRMLEGLVEKKVAYAITVDFDSVFVARHVQRLLSVIVQEQDIDALAAIQAKRGTGEVLGSRKESCEVEWTGKPIQVRSAHFGLTVIDLAKLRNVQKPWFLSQPDPRGEWSDEKLDDDVYFWRRWEEAGNSIYLDPGARLGHLEEMVTVYDSEMKKQHLYPREWEAQRDSTVD